MLLLSQSVWGFKDELQTPRYRINRIVLDVLAMIMAAFAIKIYIVAQDT